MMQLFKEYQKAGHTVILVTHNMDDVANYADDVLVMERGKLIKHASPKIVFSDNEWLKEHQVLKPTATEFASKLSNYKFEDEPLTLDELVNEIKKNVKG